MEKSQIFIKKISFVLISIGLLVLPNIWWTELNQNFVYPKVIILDFIFVIAAGLFALFDQVEVLDKKYFFILIGLTASKMLATLMNWNWVTLYSVAGAFSFLLLAIFFQQVWKKFKFEISSFFWPTVLSIYSIFCFVAYQFYHTRYLGQNPEPLFYSGPFGNINMMCEFLVFLLPWCMLLIKTTSEKKSLAAAIATYCSLTILMVGQGRSAWMGVFLCFAYEAWKGMERKQWLIYIAAILTYWGAQSLPSGNIDYNEAKKGSLAKRETLYYGASSMLLDHPLGIGGAAFEYTYIPYQLSTKEAPVEREKFNTPHNEFFKWGIENGWLYLLCAAAFFIMFFKDVWSIKANQDLVTFYRSSFLVLLPQMAFQFPFENAASAMIMAIIFGILFSQLPLKSIILPKWAKILTLIICCVLLAKASTQTYSKWVESQYTQDREAMSRGCPADRTNWRLCFFYSLKLLEGSPQESLKNTQTQLWQRPFDFHALRALGFYYISRNDQKNACEVTQVYDTFFKNISFFSQFIKDNCKDQANPVPFENSSQFYNDYLHWIGRHL